MVNRGPGGQGAEKGVTLSADKDRTNRTLVHRAIAGEKVGLKEGGAGEHEGKDADVIACLLRLREISGCALCADGRCSSTPAIARRWYEKKR